MLQPNFPAESQQPSHELLKCEACGHEGLPDTAEDGSKSCANCGSYEGRKLEPPTERISACARCGEYKIALAADGSGTCRNCGEYHTSEMIKKEKIVQ